MNNRVKYIDIAKGISILLVIIGHCLPEHNLLKQYIYTFHVPLFFLVSGMFYKKKSIKEQLKKDIKKLLVPYIITSFIIISLKSIESYINKKSVLNTMIEWFVSSLFGSGEINEFLGTEIEPIGAIWFLLSLFWVRFIFNIIMKTNKGYLKAIIIVCLNIIGFCLPNYIWLPLSMESSFIVIDFYYVGYLFSNKKVINSLNKRRIAVSLIVWGILSKFTITNCVSNYYNLYYINIIIGVIGSINIIYLCKKIENIKYLDNILSWIGKNSLYILCLHSMEGRGAIPLNKFIISNNIIIKMSKRVFFPILTVLVYRNVNEIIKQKRK